MNPGARLNIIRLLRTGGVFLLEKYSSSWRIMVTTRLILTSHWRVCAMHGHIILYVCIRNTLCRTEMKGFSLTKY